MPTDEQRAPDDVAAFVAKWEPHATLTGLIPEMCARMEADLRALIASREAAARADERAMAAAAICDGCRFGWPLLMVGDHGPFHRSGEYSTLECRAQKIRALATTSREEGKDVG